MTPVNTQPGVRKLTGTSLSPAMREILRYASVDRERGVSVANLVCGLGGTPSVRASLSRTLRRLWTRGLVELHDRWGGTMTVRSTRAHEAAESATADPEGAYLEMVSSYGDLWGSVEAFRASRVSWAEKPDLRVVHVTLTVAGRRLVEDPV